MSDRIIDVDRALQSEKRYRDATAVRAAGSLVRGEGTAYSDLDLVVVYARLPAAYRESFVFEGFPVEAFVHDPETLEYFFAEVDYPRGGRDPGTGRLIAGTEAASRRSHRRRAAARRRDGATLALCSNRSARADAPPTWRKPMQDAVIPKAETPSSPGRERHGLTGPAAMGDV